MAQFQFKLKGRSGGTDAPQCSFLCRCVYVVSLVGPGRVRVNVVWPQLKKGSVAARSSLRSSASMPRVGGSAQEYRIGEGGVSGVVGVVVKKSSTSSLVGMAIPHNVVRH